MLAEFHGGGNILDEDETWRDEYGTTWIIRQMPPETAAEILDEMRSKALSYLTDYTVFMRNRADASQRYSGEPGPEWEPTSAPYYDHCFEIMATGAPAEHEATATLWLDGTPLARALAERARAT